MKNLLSKIFSEEDKSREENKFPEIELGKKFDIYIHVLETGKGVPERVEGTRTLYDDNVRRKDLDKGNFVILDGIKGIFKIEGIYELEHSAKLRLELLRENLPKDYGGPIEMINKYRTDYQDDSFNIIP